MKNMLTKDEEFKLLILKNRDEAMNSDLHFDYYHSTRDDAFYIRPVSEEEPLASLDFRYCIAHINQEHTYEAYFETISELAQFIQDELSKIEQKKNAKIIIGSL